MDSGHHTALMMSLVVAPLPPASGPLPVVESSFFLPHLPMLVEPGLVVVVVVMGPWYYQVGSHPPPSGDPLDAVGMPRYAPPAPPQPAAATKG
jgi:hypothetical protein